MAINKTQLIQELEARDIEVDDAGDQLFLRNVTPEQGAALGAIVTGRLSGSGFAKRAVIPLTAESERKFSKLAQEEEPDSFAAWGAARNIGTPGFERLRGEGFRTVRPDIAVLEERIEQLPEGELKERLKTVPGVRTEKPRELEIREGILEREPDIERRIAEATRVPEPPPRQPSRVVRSLQGINLFVPPEEVPREPPLEERMEEVRRPSPERPTVRALTPEESRALRRRPGILSGAGEFFSRVSVRLGFGTEEEQAMPQREIRTLSGAELAGFFGAAAATLAAPTQIPRAITAARTGSSTAGRRLAQTGAGEAARKLVQSETAQTVRRLSQTRVGTFLRGLGAAEFVRVGAVQTTRPIALAGATEAEREFLRAEESRAILSRAIQESTPTIEFAEGESPIRQVPRILKQVPSIFAAELNIGLTSRERFTESIERQLRERGATDPEVSAAISAGLRFRRSAAITEAAGLVGISAVVEATGRTLSSRALASLGTIPRRRAGLTIFRAVAPPIAAAGFIEGFQQERTQQAIRMQERSLKGAAVMGAAGAATAGILGGAIAATALTQPRTSAALNLFANIADPLEKPGDILADIGEAAGKRLGVRPFRVGIVDPTKAREAFRVLTPSLAVAAPAAAPTPAPTAAPTPAPVQVPTRVTTALPATVPTPQLTATVSVEGRPVQDFIRREITPPEFVPAPPVPAPVRTEPVLPNIVTDLFTPTPAPVQEPVPVQTPVPTLVPITLPTVTPFLRIPPPVPLEFPSGVGAVGTRKVKKSKFEDELAKSQRLFRNLIGGRL